MPWTRPYRWLTFLLALTVLALGMAFGIVVARLNVGGHMTPTEERVVMASLALVGLGCLAAREEIRARNTKHELKGDINYVAAMAHTAAQEAQTAAKAAVKASEELPRRVLQELNGGLDKAVEKKLDASPFPTTHEQLAEFVRNVRDANCEQILERAYPRMLQAAREAGWKPPGEA